MNRAAVTARARARAETMSGANRAGAFGSGLVFVVRQGRTDATEWAACCHEIGGWCPPYVRQGRADATSGEGTPMLRELHVVGRAHPTEGPYYSGPGPWMRPGAGRDMIPPYDSEPCH